MRLEWHFRPGKVFHPEMCGENGTLAPRFTYLITFTEKVGITQVTPQNVEEFARRVLRYEQVMGPQWGTSEGMVPYTRDDCLKMVGLRTNATGFTKVFFNAYMAAKEDENREEERT